MKTIKITKYDQEDLYADFDSVVNAFTQDGWTFKGDYIVKAIEPPHCVNAYADLCDSVNKVLRTDKPDFIMRHRPDGRWLLISPIKNLRVRDYLP